MSTQDLPDGPLAGALDRALARRLSPPDLPVGFTERLRAALARLPQGPTATIRTLEAEHQAALAQLEAEYVRLRQRTLGTLIGAAFTTGVACALAMPWLVAHAGALSLVLLPAAGALCGLWIGWHHWLRSA